MDMKLEVVVLPVADVDRAKDFYFEDAASVAGMSPTSFHRHFRAITTTPA